MAPAEALAFGLAVAGAGLVLLATINGLTATLGLAALASYVLAYTPLKRITSLCTVVGAIPGALPPMMGWAAARGTWTPAPGPSSASSSLAAPAFPRDRLDLPGGLRARRVPDAHGHGPGRVLDGPPDGALLRGAHSGDARGRGAGVGRHGLSLRRARARARLLRGLHALRVEAFGPGGEGSLPRLDPLSSGPPGPPGLRPVMMGRLENRRMLLWLALIIAGLFFGSILFILSRAPH